MSDAIDHNALYPIREVARLTGVNPITLRAWERRYQLIEPVRTESGHRLYSQEHIDFLHETLRLMDEGVPISRIKAVISEVPKRSAATTTVTCETAVGHLVKNLCDAVSQIQIPALEGQLDRLFADYSLSAMHRLLLDVEQQLQQHKNHLVLLAFWRSSLARRLQVRLHGLYNQAVLPHTRLAIYSVPETPDYLTKLLALFCFEQGYQPLEFASSMALGELLEAAKPLAIQGILCIDQHSQARTGWSSALAKYASLPSWVFGDAGLESMQPPSVNSELRVTERWFMPLQLG